ncbi:MAG TPA: type II toxin-antitoxin system prevent-host-death family antitoxin [Bacteroidales bacterium]|nr:type II toxin-antitoxin system prevent-host-death family antitoxin [Bacteroidales bacterium]
MKATNFTEFRTQLKKYLDEVENDNEILIIKRSNGDGAVLISLNEYNSLMETVHLLSSKANADRLYESIRQMKEGDVVHKDLTTD